ncbi:DNA gyrase subunit B [Vibrio sp. S17_S38]|uniref:COG4648 family protein n=1 Tax=Vibrio sp. S17_S38 TaxID=2720229 RepID=UPI001680396A|nr:hypothetical protein [Vibrio sp. S17_S38]MBD1572699.1 DNA gyrase subunit B [Vibrio sp. S17_S38]
MNKILTALSAIVLLAYPFAVYYGLNRWGIGVIAALLGVFFLIRILAGHRSRLAELKYMAWLSGGAGIILTIFATLFKQQGWFTFYPVVVNGLMFILFVSSLWQKQTLIERLARLQDPDLPASGVQYTRTVTKVWCGYFILNGSIALYTCFQPIEVWTLYNGLISYIFGGSLFASEWLIRQWILKKHRV